MNGAHRSGLRGIGEWIALLLLFYAYAGDAPPMVNEAHYLVKAKNFWDSSYCAKDLFAASGKAHFFFYLVFGWLTKYVSLTTTAWIGRWVGWSILAAGIVRLSRAVPIHHVDRGDQYVTINLRHPSPLIIALIWIAGLQHGNLAGEWVVGGIEAKVPAYGFVLFAVAELFKRHWNRVWVLLGIASAFHVLTGGWSVIAAITAWWIIERSNEKENLQGNSIQPRLITRWLILGGLISLLGIIPAVAMSLGATTEQASFAARTYSFFRISHHLTPSAFANSWYLRFALLLCLTLIMMCTNHCGPKLRNPLSAWTIGTLLLAGCGLAIGLLPPWAPDFAAKLLRYYWFRLPDAVVPLTLGIATACSLADTRIWRRRLGYGLVAFAMLLITVHCLDRFGRKVPPSVDNRLLGWDAKADSDALQNVYEDWLLVCFWARESTPRDEIFLTPRHQQTFKWFAERAEVVNWKDVPQDTQSLIEWRRRFEQIFPQRLNTVRVTINYGELRKYREQYGVRLLIVDRRVCGENLPLVRLYPTRSADNPTYAVYELPNPATSLP